MDNQGKKRTQPNSLKRISPAPAPSVTSSVKEETSQIKSYSLEELSQLNPNARRGRKLKDPDTHEDIILPGKVLQIPVNEYELALITLGAKNNKLNVATYLRSLALCDAEERLKL